MSKYQQEKSPSPPANRNPLSKLYQTLNVCVMIFIPTQPLTRTRAERRLNAQAHGSLHFFPTARPQRPGRHRAVLLLPVAFKAGGLNLRFGTSASDMRRVYGRPIDAILRPRVGSLRKLENGAAD